MTREIALVIGAGPAGLTAAHELLTRTDVLPIVLEKSAYMGGLSRTVNYKGNRIDIGGHRFFSKSDRVMRWWLERMPLAAADARAEATGRQDHRQTDRQTAGGPHPDVDDHVMLLRSRRSRIYYQRKLFDYPVRPNLDTLRKLGLLRVLRIGSSYARSLLCPIRDATTLEHFFINRFGRELYHTFFKSYTEKVWGIPCSRISAEWGAQRVKGLSVASALLHVLNRPFTPRDLKQKDTETSLIERFLYPKYGPGQLWEQVAREVQNMGGQILSNLKVRHLDATGNRLGAVEAVNVQTGRSRVFRADYVFSTMPVKQLVRSLSLSPPERLRRINEGLVYRDFITVGLLANELKVKDQTAQGPRPIRDNWIYIQEPEVTVGRLQIFNNWSPYLVADPSKVWIGMEYFCNQHDDLWIKTDRELIALATRELAKIGMIEPADVLDGTVIRMPKTYPAYFGTYNRFHELRSWLDRLENLFLIGRNGMHRYNNMDHSMLTAMAAVDNVLEGRRDKSNIWAVNAEQEYHEVKKKAPEKKAVAPVRWERAPLSPSRPADAPPSQSPAEPQQLVLTGGAEVNDTTDPQ